MRKLFYFLWVLSGGLLISSCSKDEDYVPVPDPVVSSGIYVMNEGVWGMNNSMITYYDLEDYSAVSDFFGTVNGRGLGDTSNDLKLYGSKLYCLVNISGQMEVINPNTGISLKQISFLNGSGISKQPRYMAFDKDKVYVCSFDGTVVRVDTTSLEIEASVTAGSNPDGIAVANGKIYVSNSGGQNFPNFDHTVSVIDLDSFTETKRITVGLNPFKIEADAYGDVYVLCRGNYDDIASSLVRIDSRTDEVAETYDLTMSNFIISGDLAYYYSMNWTTFQASVKTFNVKTETPENDSFISDGTVVSAPYGIAVDETTGAVYLGDAGDYSSNGSVYCFSSAGVLVKKLNSYGVGPSQIVIRYQ